MSLVSPEGASPPERPRWKEATAADGRAYYYHKDTKETVWTIPDELRAYREAKRARKAAAATDADAEIEGRGSPTPIPERLVAPAAPPTPVSATMKISPSGDNVRVDIASDGEIEEEDGVATTEVDDEAKTKTKTVAAEAKEEESLTETAGEDESESKSTSAPPPPPEPEPEPTKPKAAAAPKAASPVRATMKISPSGDNVRLDVGLLEPAPEPASPVRATMTISPSGDNVRVDVGVDDVGKEGEPEKPAAAAKETKVKEKEVAVARPTTAAAKPEAKKSAAAAAAAEAKPTTRSSVAAAASKRASASSSSSNKRENETPGTAAAAGVYGARVWKKSSARASAGETPWNDEFASAAATAAARRTRASTGGIRTATTSATTTTASKPRPPGPPGGKKKPPPAASSAPSTVAPLTRGGVSSDEPSSRESRFGATKPRADIALAEPDYALVGELHKGFLISDAKPGKSKEDLAREKGGPRVMFSSNPKYRGKSADGHYFSGPDMNAAKPASMLKSVGGSNKDGGDAKKIATGADGKKLSKKKQEELARARLQRQRDLEARKTAAKEAAIAKDSIVTSEMEFYREIVGKMATRYNSVVNDKIRIEKELAQLQIDFAAQELKNQTLADDGRSYRGGGGAIQSVELPPEALGDADESGPASALTVDALERRIEESNRAADEEEFRTLNYGHIIIRLREEDPTSEKRRANPHATLKTSAPKALAASARNASQRRKDDVIEATQHLTWTDPIVHEMERFDKDMTSDMTSRRARLATLLNERRQAEEMLARTAASLKEKRENWQEQLTLLRSRLLASRAQDKAMNDRQKAFKEQLVKIKREAEEEAYSKASGGAPKGMRGAKGTHAKSFLQMLKSSSIALEEERMEDALRRIQAVTPDMEPDDLVATFINRREEIESIRNESVAVQSHHDYLVARHKELLEELAKEKEDAITSADSAGGKNIDKQLFAARSGEAKLESGQYREEKRMRINKLTADASEKQMNEASAAVYNLLQTTLLFSDRLDKVDPGVWTRMTPRIDESSRNASAASFSASDGKKPLENPAISRAKQGAKTKLSAVKSIASLKRIISVRRSASPTPSEDDGEFKAAREAAKAEAAAKKAAEEKKNAGKDRMRRTRSNQSIASSEDDDANVDAVNRDARLYIDSLVAFFDVIDRGNVIAAADLHKAKVQARARKFGRRVSQVDPILMKALADADAEDDDDGDGDENAVNANAPSSAKKKKSPLNDPFNVRVVENVDADSEEAAIEMEEVLEEIHETPKERDGMKIVSIAELRKRKKKPKPGETDEEELWAREQEKRLMSARKSTRTSPATAKA